MAGSIIRRGSTYYIRYELPRGADGRRRQKAVPCPGMNKKQAEQRLREVLAQLHQGMYADPSVLTFSEYLDGWLRRIEARVARTTLETYRLDVRLHIKPFIGHIRLDRITPLALQDLYQQLSKRFAPKTVRNIHGVIRGALQQAVRLRLLPFNPAVNVDPPRVPKAEIRIAGTDDLSRLLFAAQGSKYRIPIMIALATGMRRGEVLGLQWDDFEPERGWLTVQRSVVAVSGEVIVKGTKTGKGRIVPIPVALTRALLRHKESRAGANSWICTDAEGHRLKPRAFSTAFSRLVAGLDMDITLHSLRHTQATALLMAGVPVKVVAERLGHSTVATTQDIYGHVLPHMQDRAVEVIEKLLPWDSPLALPPAG